MPQGSVSVPLWCGVTRGSASVPLWCGVTQGSVSVPLWCGVTQGFVSVPLWCGVPQDSVLVSIIFTMYTAPTNCILQRHGVSYHTYAEDIQICVV